MKKLVLIDGSGFIYRSFFALPPLTRSDGLPIGAAFGFTKTLVSVLLNNSLEYFAIVFDKGKKNFRHELYNEYKQTRRETPADLIPQFSIIREACEAFNIDYLEKEGFEADDIIATYCKKAVDSGYSVKIISGDKDLVQLLRNNVEVYDPIKVQSITEELVLNKYGILPGQMRDYLALVGDTSDNVPGVKGIGVKTAMNLLNEYSSLDGIYNNLQNIKQKKIYDYLVAGKDMAILSSQLITLDEKVPMTLNIEDLYLKQISYDKVKAFCDRYEFGSLLSKIGNLNFNDNDKSQHSVVENEFNTVLTQAKENGYLIIEDNAIKTEGSFCSIDLNKIEENNFQDAINKDDYNSFIKFLEDDTVLKIAYDLKKIYNISHKIKNADDINLMAYIVIGKKDFKHITKNLYNDIKEQIQRAGLWDTYNLLDKPFQKLICDVEKRGIQLDVDKLETLKIKFQKIIQNEEERIYEIAGRNFNINSTKQLGEVLFGELKIPPIKTNKKSGNLATDQSVLEELSMHGFDIADHILEWRRILKLYSTYTDSLISKVDDNNRIHSTLNVIGTATGRLSSSDPNLQNIPIKSEEGRMIREVFVAKKGCKLISCDYSQIELRVLAEITGCKFLCDVFYNHGDVHALTAMRLFNVSEEEVTDSMRRKAKAINFGIIYGMQPFGVAKRVNLTMFESEEFIRNYFIVNPEIKHYIESIKKFAYKNGYVETLSKRRCPIPNIKSANSKLRKMSERQAINAPIQGSSADIMKAAMIAIESDPCINAKIIMQIHDELLFEVKEKYAQDELKKIIKIMEQKFFLAIPLVVNGKIGDNWADIH